MPELATFITVIIASFFLSIVPGPSVTVIVANSLRGGVKAGLLCVAGTQLGVFTMVLIVAIGLETFVSLMGEAFFWIKLLGAAYLIWLGIKLMRSDGKFGVDEKADSASKNYFWQGCFVLWSNPKALLFLGAFIPQFVDMAGNYFWQTMILGFCFMAVTTVCDSVYAIMAGQAGSLLSRKKVRIAEITSGFCLIGGGVWLASTRSN